MLWHCAGPGSVFTVNMTSLTHVWIQKGIKAAGADGIVTIHSSMFLKMKLIFFVVALLVSTTAALEKDHLVKLKDTSRELKLADHFEAKGISPGNLARVRRGFDPQCYNAGLQVVQKCPFNFSVFTDAYAGSEDAALTVKQLNDILCSNDGCYNAVLNVYKICEELQVNIHLSRSFVLTEMLLITCSFTYQYNFSLHIIELLL